MKADALSLLDKVIRVDGVQYVVPAYQRDYTWRKDREVAKLLADVRRLLRGECEEHFLGTVVYVVVETKTMVEERSIVDGQQRVVTLFLILNALRQICVEMGLEGQSNARWIARKYLEDDLQDSEYRYRLRPSVSDDKAYEFVARGIPGKYVSEVGRESTIFANYLSIKAEMVKMVSNYSVVDVMQALAKLKVVAIELGKEDDAQQIFESINSTGQLLTAADLIRNFIMMRQTNEVQETIHKCYWLELGRIMPDSRELAEFFRYYLQTKTYETVKKGDLYEKFKVYWRSCLDKRSVYDSLEEVKCYANHYQRLKVADGGDALGEAISVFRAQKSDMAVPFLMQVLEYNASGTIDDASAVEIFKLVNSYLVRRYIVNAPSNVLARVFSTLLRKLVDKMAEPGQKRVVDACVGFLVNANRDSRSQMPSDAQVRRALAGSFAALDQRNTWILEQVEKSLRPGVVLPRSGLAYVMRRSPNKYWSDVMQGQLGAYDAYASKLGNMTLVELGRERMNDTNFSEAKVMLSGGKEYLLNKEVCAKSSWTMADIDARTEDLTNRIIALFPYRRSKGNYDKSREAYVEMNYLGVSAAGVVLPGGKMRVFVDSTLRYDLQPKDADLVRLRSELLQDEIVVCKNGEYRFVEDYEFASVLMATEFILGEPKKGQRAYWLDGAGNVVD